MPAVHLDHGTPRERELHALTVDAAARYLAEGQFAAGSMGPKIAAAIRFIEEGLIILGWVANWRPIEIFQYEWWPIVRRRNLTGFSFAVSGM